MSDIIDRAQQRGQEWLHEQLAHHARRVQRHSGAPAMGRPDCPDCQDCGEPIPQARRQALPGARRCVGCQAALERGKKESNRDDFAD